MKFLEKKSENASDIRTHVVNNNNMQKVMLVFLMWSVRALVDRRSSRRGGSVLPQQQQQRGLSWRSEPVRSGYEEAAFAMESSSESVSLFDGSTSKDWQVLTFYARSAALTYYEWPVIVAAFEASLTRREADAVRRHGDGQGVEARWGRNTRLVVREVPSVGMRYFVRIEKNGPTHVAIKGSDNARNFRDDVDYAKVVDPLCEGARLHRGFKRVADAIWADLLLILPDLFIENSDEKKKSFALTGHSLGGGAATILGMRLAARGCVVSKVVSFGAPKVTNSRGAHLFASRVPLLRVLTNDDPIPTFPSMDFASHIFGFYRHFGHRLVLYEDEEEDDLEEDDIVAEEVDDDDDEDSTLGGKVSSFLSPDDDDDDDVDVKKCSAAEKKVRYATVFLSPCEASGLPRKRENYKVHGRYASRPDPRWLGAAFRRRHDYLQITKDNNLGEILKHNRVLLAARLKDFALWHLDDSFFFHAHHVSPMAHTMDTYEAAVQGRQTCRELLKVTTFRSPLLGFRRKRRRRIQARKNSDSTLQVLRKRGPYAACLIVLSHRLWKWRRVLKLFRPKYIILSFLFIGWTGSGGATSRHHHDDTTIDDDLNTKDGISPIRSRRRSSSSLDNKR